MALRNDRRIGIMNGTPGTIAGVEDGNLLIDTHDGQRLKVPARYAWEHLPHG